MLSQVRKNSDTIGLPIIEEAIVRIVQGLSEPPLPDRCARQTCLPDQPWSCTTRGGVEPRTHDWLHGHARTVRQK